MDISNEDFVLFQKEVYSLLGITLNDSKKQLVVSRLSSRINELGLQSFRDYYTYLKSLKSSDEEIKRFTEKMVTNETYFFRESKHFDILSALAVEHYKKNFHLRIWSAPCSTGEEAYSIAMTMNEVVKKNPGKSFDVLATDVSEKVLQTAKLGRYKKQSVESKVPEDFKKYFKNISDEEYQVDEKIQARIKFKCVNLVHDRFPLKMPIDIIFCRNLFIYFNDETKQTVVKRFHEHLSKSGFLFIGHSENLMSMADMFKLLGGTVYQKVNN